MKARPFTRRDRDESKIVFPVTIEFRAIITGKLDALSTVYEEYNAAVEKLYASCDRLGVSIVRADGQMRPLSQEELLSALPRKFHRIGIDGKHVCDTAFVSPRFLTDIDEKVTCKKCLRVMGNRPNAYERIASSVDAYDQIDRTLGATAEDALQTGEGPQTHRRR